MKTIDCTGMQCPIPVTKIKEYFDSIGEGEAVVVVDNEIANVNVINYAIDHGYKYESVKSNNEYEIIIEKRGCLEVVEDRKEISIVITSNKIGEDNNRLGQKLMEEYIDTLSEEYKLPSNIIFMNDGVKLLVKESKVIEEIHLLEEKGVKIYASDTSLNDFKLINKLIVGKIVDMSFIIDVMNNSDNVIKL